LHTIDKRINLSLPEFLNSDKTAIVTPRLPVKNPLELKITDGNLR
jgi:hypothetical protein